MHTKKEETFLFAKSYAAETETLVTLWLFRVGDETQRHSKS